MLLEKQVELFSKKRLSSYCNAIQHYENFLLIQNLSIKIGILEIVTRNKIAKLLNINDDAFISTQTLGYWCENISAHKIHNMLIDIRHIDFR